MNQPGLGSQVVYELKLTSACTDSLRARVRERVADAVFELLENTPFVLTALSPPPTLAVSLGDISGPWGQVWVKVTTTLVVPQNQVCVVVEGPWQWSGPGPMPFGTPWFAYHYAHSPHDIGYAERASSTIEVEDQFNAIRSFERRSRT